MARPDIRDRYGFRLRTPATDRPVTRHTERVRTSGDEVTAREAEVLALVGQHLTNAQIAATLFISVRTVESHVAANRTQVGVSSGRIVSLVVQDDSRFQVYACLDVSTVQVFDANGESAQILGRATVYPMSVTFENLADGFSVSDESVWGGDDFCR